ncbi:MAG: hypothetical protein ACPG7R_10405, partial [Planctomycetota bacterium]
GHSRRQDTGGERARGDLCPSQRDSCLCRLIAPDLQTDGRLALDLAGSAGDLSTSREESTMSDEPIRLTNYASCAG